MPRTHSTPPLTPVRSPKPVAAKPRLPVGAIGNHRFRVHRSVVDGIDTVWYDCPCGHFQDSGADKFTHRKITRAEARRRYDRHLSL